MLVKVKHYVHPSVYCFCSMNTVSLLFAHGQTAREAAPHLRVHMQLKSKDGTYIESP